MMKKLLHIGEHTVLVHSSSKRLMDWMKVYFQVLDTNSHLNLRSPDLYIRITDGYGIPFSGYDVHITSDHEKISYKRADYLIEINPEYNDAHIYVNNDFALKHAMVNLYSAFIVHKGWGLLIHSSCVVNSGKAYLFAGQSGAGKSTVAALSLPRPILSDEATLVKIQNNDIQVFDSPFRSEVVPLNVHRSCPLEGIFLLIQSSDVKTSITKKSVALLQILDKIFFWHHDRKETSKLFNLCKALIDKTAVNNLYFQKNDTFWELIS